jgi:hypothetical protein
MTDVLLAVFVLGVIVLALAVDLAVLWGFIARRRR